MAGDSKTTHASDVVLNFFLRGVPFTPPPVPYLKLFTSAPGESGAGAEVSGGSYAPQALTFGAPASAGTTGRKCSTTADCVFPAATANWGVVKYAAIADGNGVGAKILYQAELTTERTVIAGDQFNFKAGNITVTED